MIHQDIGVIGSGMAGLCAAYLCKRAGHHVTVFESAPARGMDAHAVEVPTDGGRGLVDAPLRVMSGTGWRSVLALCAEVGVGTFQVDTPISLSWLDKTTWLRTGTLHLGSYSLPTLGALHYLHRDTLRIVRDLARLRRDLAASHAASAAGEKPLSSSNMTAAESVPETIEEFFTRRKYAPIFWRGFLLPLLGTVTTCRMEYLLKYPAQELLVIVRDIIFGKPLRRIQGGTRALVNQLAKDLCFVSGAAVTAVKESSSAAGQPCVRVMNARGEERTFDRLIVATQANALSFLGEACQRERQVLNNIEFDHGELVTHTDASIMPRRRDDWTPLNYLIDKNLNENMFTVWINPVEPTLSSAEPVFQTWNTLLPIDPQRILSRVPLQRAVQSIKTEKTLAELATMHRDPLRRIYFCGSWAAPGVPLLESAVRSAINVAHEIGITVPWDPAPSAGAK